MNKSYYRTDYLFPETSFLTGAGSIFSIFGNYFSFNGSDSAAAADSAAIESDFGVVGRDIETAIGSYGR